MAKKRRRSYKKFLLYKVQKPGLNKSNRTLYRFFRKQYLEIPKETFHLAG